MAQQRSYRHIEVRPVAGALGAKIQGVDTAYIEKPPMASMLYAVEIPLHGGDTLFANQYLAYEMLSQGLKQALNGIVSINSSTKADASRTREDRLRDTGAEAKVLIGEHPVHGFRRVMHRVTLAGDTPR